MIPNLPHEEVLRSDVLTAKTSFDAAREAIANNQVSEEEGKFIHKAALADMLRPFAGFPAWYLMARFRRICGKPGGGRASAACKRVKTVGPRRNAFSKKLAFT
jgi:hypothetical protein